MKKQALPESRLIKGEVTLRELTLTDDVRLTKKSLVRYIALSAGLISPNESRTTLVDLLEVLLWFQLCEKKDPTVEELVAEMKKLDSGHNEKAVRYHLGELTKAGILQREKGRYRFPSAHMAEERDVAAGLEQVLRSKAEASLSNIKTALELLKHMHAE